MPVDIYRACVGRLGPVGSTPPVVCDVSASLLSLIAQFVDPALRYMHPEAAA